MLTERIPPSVPASVSLCLYRIVQEALHNAARHSQASSAQVSVTYDNGQIGVQIADSASASIPSAWRMPASASSACGSALPPSTGD